MSAPTPRRYRAAAGTARRRPRVRRASAGLTPTRSAALLAMLVAAGAIYGLSATSAFGFGRLSVEGTVLTAEAAVRDQVGLEPGTNLVGLATEPIAERIRTIPSVAAAEVSVGLPDLLRVRIRERRAIVVWAVGDRRFAVDEGGMLFSDLAGAAPESAAGVPVITDERAVAVALGIRSPLDPVLLDAATRLGSLTPGQIGSQASGLRVRVTDERGFTVSSGSGGWLAVFGFYGRSQRTPALIPGQVQLLAALLAGREDTIQTVILADDRDGTFIPRATPRPMPRP